MTRILEHIGMFALGAGVCYSWAKVRRKPARTLRKRHQVFLSGQNGTQLQLSPDLLLSVRCLLANALEQRKGMWRSPKNHATNFAPGVIVLSLTALDAWLSELIGVARTTGAISTEDAVAIIDRPLPEKYQETSKRLSQQPIKPSGDLKLLNEVRHEIIHYLPYVQNVASGQTVPTWLAKLEQQQLLIKSPNPMPIFTSAKSLAPMRLRIGPVKPRSRQPVICPHR